MPDSVINGTSADDFFQLGNHQPDTVTVFGGDGADTFLVSGDGPLVLYGEAGDDLVRLESGQQTITVQATVTLGAGRDRLLVGAETYLPPRVIVTDFTPGDQGDRMVLQSYLFRLSQYSWNTNTNPFEAGLVRVTQAGDAIVQVKVAGDWRDLFVLQGVTAGQLTAANFEGFSPNGGPASGLDIVGTPGADALFGGPGDDTITGAAGADALGGGVGSDLVYGNDGDDTLSMSLGVDTFHGGAGDDRLDGYGVSGAAFYGEAGRDSFSLTRTDSPQGQPLLLDMGDGDDVASYYGRGAATLVGGEGNDQLSVGGYEFLTPTEVTIDAGPGNDVVTVSGGGRYLITLGQGSDTIATPTSFVLDSDTGRGTQGVVLDFSLSEDRISVQIPGFRLGQMDGEAVIQGPGQADRDVWQNVLQLKGVGALSLTAANFTAGLPDPWLLGNTGNDVLTAGGGFSRLDGGAGDDQLLGGALGDILRGSVGNDSLFGAVGDDSLDGGRGADTLSGGAGNDVIADFAGANYLRGDDGADRITGGFEFDDANGNMGDDTVSTGAGDDYAVGGKDNDSLSGEAGGDIVWGNLGNDTQDGGDGNDQVRGGQGDDTIAGGAGDDFVSGDRGNDTEAGGAGADRFHGSQDAGIDRVLDFHISESDRVMLDPGTTYTLAQVGADTVIDMGGGNQMILVGVQMSTLTPGWIFGA